MNLKNLSERLDLMLKNRTLIEGGPNPNNPTPWLKRLGNAMAKEMRSSGYKPLGKRVLHGSFLTIYFIGKAEGRLELFVKYEDGSGIVAGATLVLIDGAIRSARVKSPSSAAKTAKELVKGLKL